MHTRELQLIQIIQHLYKVHMLSLDHSTKFSQLQILINANANTFNIATQVDMLSLDPRPRTLNWPTFDPINPITPYMPLITELADCNKYHLKL